MEGWVKLYRKLTESALWTSEPFTKGQAWVDLLAMANHTDGRILINGGWFDIQRGQLHTSELKLASRWKWSKGKVTRFLNVLKMDGMLNVECSKGGTTNGTTLTIVNYSIYQDSDTTDSTTNGQRTVQRTVQRTDNGQYINKNDKNDKNVKNERKKEEKKNIYGEFSNVKLTNAEYERLKNDFGNELEGIINYLSAYIVERHYTSYSHNLAIRRWVVSAYREQKQRTTPAESDKTTTTEQKPQRLVGPGTFEVNGITVRLGEDEYINAQGKRHYYYTVSGKRYNSEEKGFPDVPLTAPARIYNSDGTIYLRDGQCWGQLG